MPYRIRNAAEADALGDARFAPSAPTRNARAGTRHLPAAAHADRIGNDCISRARRLRAHFLGEPTHHVGVSVVRNIVRRLHRQLRRLGAYGARARRDAQRRGSVQQVRSRLSLR